MAATLITFTQAQVNNFVELIIWPTARVLAFISIAPFFSSSWLPMLWRLGLGLSFSWAILPALPHAISWPGIWGAAIILMAQILVGIGLAMVFRAMLSVFSFAGSWIALSMGLGFATTISQQYGEESSTLGEIFSFCVLLLMIADGAIYGMIHVLAISFQLFPIGTVWPDWSWLKLANYGQIVFTDGVLIALPVIMMVLIANVGMAVIARVAPQVNLFAIGFPVLIMVGMVSLYWLIPWLPDIVSHLFSLSIKEL
ncbi:MAG: flagellar biosynthetic protein FliR [Acidithiobacillus sp.]|nr:flagellar biosynthetic protein FliR [Acidithiobacillus sp.]